MCAVTWAGAKVGLRLRLRLRLRARVGCARARADPRRGSGAPTHGRGSGLGAHPGSLGEHNTRNAPCPKPTVCPAQWRTARPARSHRLRSARNATRRPGGVGLSCWAIACGGGPPPKARKSCTGCACASGCGTTRGTVARVCCDRQATGATPTVRKVRFSSEWGRCVTP